MADNKKKAPASKASAQKKKITSKIWKNYSASGSAVSRKNKFCPKCGTGVFMAQHKDRSTCGKCGYMEKTSKQ